MIHAIFYVVVFGVGLILGMLNTEFTVHASRITASIAACVPNKGLNRLDVDATNNVTAYCVNGAVFNRVGEKP